MDKELVGGAGLQMPVLPLHLFAAACGKGMQPEGELGSAGSGAEPLSSSTLQSEWGRGARSMAIVAVVPLDDGCHGHSSYTAAIRPHTRAYSDPAGPQEL